MKKPKALTENLHHWAEQAVLPLPPLVTVWLNWQFQGCQVSQSRTGGSKGDQPFHEPQNSTPHTTVLKTLLQMSFLHNHRQRRWNTCHSCNLSTLLSVSRGALILLGSHLLVHWGCRTDRQYTLEGVYVPRILEVPWKNTLLFYLESPSFELRDFHANSGIQGAHSEDTDRRTKDRNPTR